MENCVAVCAVEWLGHTKRRMDGQIDVCMRMNIYPTLPLHVCCRFLYPHDIHTLCYTTHTQ